MKYGRGIGEILCNYVALQILFRIYEGKYEVFEVLNIVCKMSKDSEKKEFSQEQKVTIIGTVSNYKQSAEKSPNTLYINDCFAE